MKDSASARRPLHLHRVSVTLAVMLGVLLACDSSTDRPNAPSGPVVIVLVTVNAPASLAPGQSAQLTATAVRSDRSTEAATAQWSSSDPAVVQVDAAGVATARALRLLRERGVRSKGQSQDRDKRSTDHTDALKTCQANPAKTQCVYSARRTSAYCGRGLRLRVAA